MAHLISDNDSDMYKLYKYTKLFRDWSIEKMFSLEPKDLDLAPNHTDINAILGLDQDLHELSLMN